ncbi:hypothetical protein SLS62_011093 [Diatrype stigma]|uniref:ABM domain-containing protein n=1 Tax=Diatrype stigma TaxID=117547 RepID=A0AAN9UE61_9PEZI
MAPVTEIVRFTPREGQEAEFQTVLASTASTLQQQPGCQAVHSSATLEEDNPLHVLLVDWDTIESHQAFEASPAYAPFAEKLGPVLAAPPVLYHVAFAPAHPPVLRNSSAAKSAVTELLHLYFPAGDAFTADQVAGVARDVQTFLDRLLPEHVAGITGEVAAGWALEEIDYKGEKARAFVAAVGWESLEAHHKYRDTEHFAKSIPLIRGLAGLKGADMFHLSTKTW